MIALSALITTDNTPSISRLPSFHHWNWLFVRIYYTAKQQKLLAKQQSTIKIGRNRNVVPRAISAFKKAAILKVEMTLATRLDRLDWSCAHFQSL